MALYAFDGTWNTDKTEDHVDNLENTNVSRFVDAYDQHTEYIPGVGTRFGIAGRIFGGIAGFGGLGRTKETYKHLCKNWERGDRVIDIVGFSRGAALALNFSNYIESKGIQKPGTNRVVEPNPKIRFLGLWDVVSSFGIPINLFDIRFQEINIGYKLKLPKIVEHGFHAMALDERRQTFVVTRLPEAYEVWFRGVHSDIGGGNRNTALSHITLRWMLRKARLVNLPIKENYLALLDGVIRPDAPISENKDFIKNPYRKLGEKDRFHYTVKPKPDHCNPPENCTVETETDEVSRKSVAER
jgi:Uncharacterized conserved protein